MIIVAMACIVAALWAAKPFAIMWLDRRYPFRGWDRW